MLNEEASERRQFGAEVLHPLGDSPFIVGSQHFDGHTRILCGVLLAAYQAVPRTHTAATWR
jgi:hypothetical protein